jgi:hypothetical protein
MVSENKAKEIAAANNKAEDDVLDGAWTYDAVPVTEQKAKALHNRKLIDSMPLSVSKLWVVEVYDDTGEYMGTL